MPDNNNANYESDFMSWLRMFLKDRNLQYSKCGSKVVNLDNTRHSIDTETGTWKNPGYSGTKPPRWLMNLHLLDGSLSSSLPSATLHNIGAANTSQRDKAGLLLRILPLIRKRPVKYRLKATSAVPKSAGRGGRELLDLAFPGHLLSGYYAALPLSAFQAFCQ